MVAGEDRGMQEIYGCAELGEGVGTFVSRNACVQGDPHKGDRVADECEVVESSDSVMNGPAR